MDWFAKWELGPWGEKRADLRNAALVCWLMRPHLEDPPEPPAIDFPYFEGTEAEAIDVTAGLANLEEHKRRYGFQVH